MSTPETYYSVKITFSEPDEHGPVSDAFCNEEWSGVLRNVKDIAGPKDTIEIFIITKTPHFKGTTKDLL